MTGTPTAAGPPDPVRAPAAARGVAGLSRRGLLGLGLGLAPAVLAACTGTPAPTASGPRTPAPRHDPNPDYQASDGFLYAPDGTLFTPLGANVGTTASFDWKGDAQGHSAAATAWGWNTVRLNLMVTGAQSWSYVAQRSQQELLALVTRIVEEYTAAGIVVVLDAHDNPRAKGLDEAEVLAGMVAWWQAAATAFKDNPRVWHGLINEPAYTNDDWVRVLDSLAGTVRGTGNNAPILLGASCWGQDVGYSAPNFTDARFAYEPTMAPVLSQRYGNVILEQHNYGAFGLYSTPELFGAYVEKVRDAGLTPLIGEFGYTVSKDKSPNVYQSNYDAAQAVFEIAGPRSVGALWWHATHGDNYSVTADGSAFWNSPDGTGLSDGGARLWQLGHPEG